MKWFLIAAAFVLLPCSAPAQTDSLTAPSHPNSLQAGMWAFQFDVNGELLSIESFAGGLSIKRQFSPTWALRFGVGFSAQGSSLVSDSGDPEFESDSDAYGVSVETAYQRYVNPRSAVNAYWALGPLFDYDHGKNEASRDSVLSRETRTAWSAGAVGALGVEWFFTSQFSLHAEYTARVLYTRRELESVYGRTGQPEIYRKREDDGWSFGTSDVVRFGLSVYF